MANRLDQRIAKLEWGTKHIDDASVVAWGQTVTDAELRSLAVGPLRLDAQGADRGRTQRANTMTDAELYRLITPAIEALRRNG